MGDDLRRVPEMGSSSPAAAMSSCPILYVMVVGFHHKKGCLIDFCYPPLTTAAATGADTETPDSGASAIELPTAWKSLPSLAIPDGAHNFDNDTVFFHLPDLNDPGRTVFGVACYQQVPTKSLLVRTPDMTRSSVQKSVVAILRYPLYGWVERKLKIVTRSYFGERDFSRTEILEQFHHSMSLQLKPTLLETTEMFQGLSLRSLFVRFGGAQILILFKLMLLERKTLFIMSPIRQLCGTILALCSLFPGLLQEGMVRAHLPVDFYNNKNKDNEEPDKKLIKRSELNTVVPLLAEESSETKLPNSSGSSTISAYDDETDDVNDDDPDDLIAIDDDHFGQSGSTTREYQEILIKHYRAYGLPLPLFQCHSYCLPYCSISCFESLNHERVRSCVAGSSNSIFQRWENDIDVFVADSEILIQNVRLKRILTPTAEDSHFMSFLMREIDPGAGDEHDDHQNGEEPNNHQDGDPEDYLFAQRLEPYKGSDSWLRYHFKNYLLHMLRCSMMDETSKEYRSFNAGFMSEWKTTYNYNQWCNQEPTVLDTIRTDVDPRHPFSGTRPLHDIRFKISNFFTNRHEQVGQASKQALNTARSTLTSWMSTLAGSYHGQQAKTLLNKTVQLANQLIEDDDDDDDDESISSQDFKNNHNNDDDVTRVSTKSKQKPKTKDQQEAESSFGFLDSDDAEEEQETSV